MAAKKAARLTSSIGERVVDAKRHANRHELEQLEQTLGERRAALVEANERTARVNTEFELAVGEARTRLAALESDIAEAQALRESMLVSNLVTAHATKVYEWMLALPGERCCIVSLVDGGIDLQFVDEEGEPTAGPEQPVPPAEEEPPTLPDVGAEPAHPLVIDLEVTDLEGVE